MDTPENRRDNGRIWAGLLLVGVGSLLFLQKAGFPFPYWLFRWPMILIAVGLFLGIRHNFRNPSWIILVVIGSVFLLDMIEPGYSIKQYSAPIIFTVIGLMLIFRTRPGGTPRLTWGRNANYRRLPERPEAYDPGADAYAKEDYIDSVAFFGNVRKVIVSKNFKGGEMVAVFGGNEMDFTQADMTEPVILDVTQIFGGTKLLVPAHWEVKSEIVAIFGGIEDKRIAMPGTTSTSRILILKGTSIFGGIQVRSY